MEPDCRDPRAGRQYHQISFLPQLALCSQFVSYHGWNKKQQIIHTARDASSSREQVILTGSGANDRGHRCREVPPPNDTHPSALQPCPPAPPRLRPRPGAPVSGPDGPPRAALLTAVQPPGSPRGSLQTAASSSLFLLSLLLPRRPHVSPYAGTVVSNTLGYHKKKKVYISFMYISRNYTFESSNAMPCSTEEDWHFNIWS